MRSSWSVDHVSDHIRLPGCERWDDVCCPRMTASVCPERQGLMCFNPHHMLCYVKNLCIKHSLHSESPSVMDDVLEVFGAQPDGSGDSRSRLLSPDGSALGRVLGLPNFFHNGWGGPPLLWRTFRTAKGFGRFLQICICEVGKRFFWPCVSLTGVCRSKPSPEGCCREASEKPEYLREAQEKWWPELKTHGTANFCCVFAVHVCIKNRFLLLCLHEDQCLFGCCQLVVWSQNYTLKIVSVPVLTSLYGFHQVILI